MLMRMRIIKNDEGFEDEDWVIAVFNKLSLVSDQIYI